VDFALSIEILAKDHSICRDAEIKPQRIFVLVFFGIFFCQKQEKRRPGSTGYSGKSGVLIASPNFLHRNIAFYSIDKR